MGSCSRAHFHCPMWCDKIYDRWSVCLGPAQFERVIWGETVQIENSAKCRPEAISSENRKCNTFALTNQTVWAKDGWPSGQKSEPPSSLTTEEACWSTADDAPFDEVIVHSHSFFWAAIIHFVLFYIFACQCGQWTPVQIDKQIINNVKLYICEQAKGEVVVVNIYRRRKGKSNSLGS